MTGDYGTQTSVNEKKQDLEDNDCRMLPKQETASVISTVCQLHQQGNLDQSTDNYSDQSPELQRGCFRPPRKHMVYDATPAECGADC